MSEINHYAKLLELGAISRREFIGRAVALGVTLTAATTMASRVAKAAPKKGGRLRMGLTGGGTGDTLDPAQSLDSYIIIVSMGQLRNALTEIDSNNNLVGELAESWSASDDASVWTFKLRQGVEFHNGKTFDANDVVETFNHHRGEDTKSAAKGIIASITDIKADGKNTVVFTLSGGSADFPYIVSDYHLVICPAKDGGGIDWESGVGTGGYSLVTYDPGVRTLTKRNPNYWKQGFAHFDEIESLQIADVVARTSALQTGEIDVMSNVDLKTVNMMKRQPEIQVFKTTGNKHCTLPMITTKAPFDNNDVRLALKYAIDREQWVRVILKGYGEIGNDIPLGPANQFRASADEIPQRVYDPDKAKWHLEQAGMSSLSVELHMSDTAFEGAVDAGQLYAETAKPAGIDIKIVREPKDGYWSNVWLKKPWSASYWGGRPTEDWIFSQIYSSGADWNETFWENERFNKLLIQGRAELDQTKRREIYLEMQRIVRDDGGSVIPMFMSYVAAATTKIQLPDKMASNWELDGEKLAERWWFA